MELSTLSMVCGEIKLNITHNCLDRHVNSGKRNQVAFIYVNENDKEIKITYRVVRTS